MLPADRGQELSVTVYGMVAPIQFASVCWRRSTGAASTKRVDRANSVFWDPSDTTNEGPLQQNFYTEGLTPLR
jgi:hypothetical protein